MLAINKFMHTYPRLTSSANEIAQPSWIRLALVALLATATNVASDRSKEYIIDRLAQLPPDNEARNRAAEQYFNAGFTAFEKHDFDQAISDFTISNRALSSPMVVINIVTSICRSLGYQHLPLHPLQQASIGYWRGMSSAELMTDPEYIQAITTYEAELKKRNNENRLVTLKLGTRNFRERSIAIGKLTRVQILVRANIDRLKQLLWSEGLGGERGITAENSCDSIPNFLPENADRFATCNQNMIELRKQENMLAMIDEALQVLGDALDGEQSHLTASKPAQSRHIPLF